MYNAKKITVITLLCASLGLLSQQGYASEASVLSRLFFHPKVAVHRPTVSTKTLKSALKAHNAAQWVDMGWPSAKPSDSQLNAVSFNAQGNLYAIVGEGMEENTPDADMFVTTYADGAWHTLSPIYTDQDAMTKGGLVPMGLSVYNNTPYALLGSLSDPAHPDTTQIILNVYKYEGGVNWVVVPNSTLKLDMKTLTTFNSPEPLGGNNGKFVITEVTAPAAANMSIYDPAHTGWKTVSIPLPANTEVNAASFDATGNIYMEYDVVGDNILNTGVERYDFTTGSWDTTIPSVATAFANDKPEEAQVGDRRYYVGPANTFYSFVTPDAVTYTLYQNVQGVWLKNNPISMPADGLYPASITPMTTSNGLYTLNCGGDNCNSAYVEYYNGGHWQNLGADSGTAIVAGNQHWFLLNSENMLSNNNDLYVVGTEKSNGKVTLLKLMNAAGN